MPKCRRKAIKPKVMIDCMHVGILMISNRKLAVCMSAMQWWQCGCTIRCKVGALAGEGVRDSAERLGPLRELAHIPHTHAVIAAGRGKQPLRTRLNLQRQPKLRLALDNEHQYTLATICVLNRLSQTAATSSCRLLAKGL